MSNANQLLTRNHLEIAKFSWQKISHLSQEEAYGTCTDTLVWWRLLLAECGLPSVASETHIDSAYVSFIDYVYLLKSHDWSFEYSDDSKVVKAGRENLSLINNLQLTIDPAFKIWNEFCHPNYKRS